MISVTHGYARFSRTDRDERNLETQLHILQEFGIHEERFLTDEMSGNSPTPRTVGCWTWWASTLPRRGSSPTLPPPDLPGNSLALTRQWCPRTDSSQEV